MSVNIFIKFSLTSELKPLEDSILKFVYSSPVDISKILPQICPSNSTDEIKAAADIILEKSCEEDAIADVIDYIFNRCEK